MQAEEEAARVSAATPKERGPEPGKKRETLYLVDGSGYIFRAFFAIRSLATRAGLPTNALFGFTQMLLKLIEDEAPDYLAVVFDPPGDSFRKAIYPKYKENRSEKPPDLLPQLPLVRDIVRAFRIPALEVDGFEADDVIATLARMAEAEEVDTVVVSSDKDLMQLVDAECVLYDTMKSMRYDEAGVVAKLGVRPAQVLDLLALMGDSSDNIPGVPGVGPKTACLLLEQFGTLDALYERLGEVKGKRRENLADNRDKALLSRELATLRRDVPLDLPGGLADLRRQEPDNKALNELFTRLEFSGLAGRYVDAPPPASGPELLQTGFRTAQSEAALDALARALTAAERFAFQVFTSDTHPVAARLVGLAFATDLERAWYVPLGHWTLEPEGQLAAELVLGRLSPLLADPAREKLVTDVKTAIEAGARHGFALRGVTCDPMLASYLVDAGQFEHSLDNIAKGSLGHEALAYTAIAGSGKRQEPPQQVPVASFAPWACERVQLTIAATDALRPRLAELEQSAALLTDVELPLARVLAAMELTGVRVDVPLLHALSAELGARARALEADAHAAAGKDFALGSPKQLGDVLFGDLGLPTGKKTRTGWSTDSEVLEELREHHPLPGLVLEWRKLQKLKSTYTDVLPALVRPETGRVHTSFNQAVAATGRLSSENPNLQNIPIRTDEGRRIRAAFIPADGNVLVSADYSQIELRILAHLSGDERMTRGFLDGADIHRRTASEMLGVPEGDITSQQRGMAKAVNFGILYGMSAVRLAREQGITRSEARDYIDAYYARYPRVRRWKEDVLSEARLRGYVSTLFGRVRLVGDLRARNRMASMAAERVAINTPVQGSAADIIKIAMVSLHARLERELPEARLLLQVHDELVLEVPAARAEELVAVTQAEMVGVIELAAPLTVNAAVGATWLEAH